MPLKDYPIIVTEWQETIKEFDMIITDMKRTCCKFSKRRKDPAGFIICHTERGFILCREITFDDKRDYDFMVRLKKQNCFLGLEEDDIVLRWSP